MTTILLCLLGYGVLMFLAGMRYVTVKQWQRDNRRGGYLNLVGKDIR